MQIKSYKKAQQGASFLKYVILIAVGFVMVYPLIWMIGATFKTNNEIFSSISPFTTKPTFDGYKAAMIYYPEFLRSLKESMQDGNEFKHIFNYIKKIIYPSNAIYIRFNSFFFNNILYKIVVIHFGK